MANPQFNIVNRTTDGNNLNLAFYQRFSRHEGHPIVAWRTIAPKIGTPTYIPALYNYAVFVKYKVNLVEYQTKPLPINNLTGTYEVSRTKDKLNLKNILPDYQQGVVAIKSLPEVAITIEPCITLGANLVFPPQRMPPASNMMIQIMPEFYVAIVPASITMGTIMTDQDVMATETPIRAGQTLYLNGSAADGYNLSIENP